MDSLVVAPSGRMVLGTAQWGLPYGIANDSGPPPNNELRAILELAIGARIRTLDTARAYGSEEVIGRHADLVAGCRIITKLSPAVYSPGMSCGESLHELHRSISTSQKMLKRNGFDLLLHRAEHRHAHDGALWDELIAMKHRGEIVNLGVSVSTVNEGFGCLDDEHVSCIQVPASLLDQRFLRAGFFTRAHEQGKEVFVRSIFLQGIAFLSPEKVPWYLPEIMGPIRAIRDWAAARGRGAEWAFLRHALSLPNTRPIVGVEKADQFDEILELSKDLETIDMANLEAMVPDLPAEELDPAQWPPQRPKSAEHLIRSRRLTNSPYKLKDEK